MNMVFERYRVIGIGIGIDDINDSHIATDS